MPISRSYFFCPDSTVEQLHMSLIIPADLNLLKIILVIMMEVKFCLSCTQHTV